MVLLDHYINIITWKILDNEEAKLTPEQIAESISRLDSKDLAKLGDELVIKELAERVAFLCNVSLQEKDYVDETL